MTFCWLFGHRPRFCYRDGAAGIVTTGLRCARCRKWLTKSGDAK